MIRQPLLGETIVPRDREQTARALRRFVVDAGRLALRAQCALPSLATQIEPLHDVIVEFTAIHAYAFFVHWYAVDGGAFPRFAGTLLVHGDGETTRLRLEGEYDDPARERDAVVEGRLAFRLAQAMCRSTLGALQARM